MAATIQNIEFPTKPRALDSSTSIQEIGQELITNGDLSSAGTVDATSWVLGWSSDTANVTIASDELVLTRGVGAYSTAYATDGASGRNIMVSGNTYSFTYTVSDNDDGSSTVANFVYGDGGSSHSAPVTVGTHTVTFTAAGSHFGITNRSSNSILKLDDLSLKQVESFSNNNHGKIYSGRALEFDGVTDYFQHNGGATLAGVNEFDAGVPWTFACWIYFDSSTTNNTHYFVGEDNTSHPLLAFSTPQKKLQFRENTASLGKLYYDFPNGHGSSLSKMEEDTWHRIVVTTNGTYVTAYVNGVHAGDITVGQADTSDTGTFSVTNMEFSGWGCPYQTGGNRLYHLKGMMSDGQVWDATWSADDAAYDFANPESLALNASGTALTESNLKIWYPMQDGHRGQQSYILDGANTGTGGAEIVLNADFSDNEPADQARLVGGLQFANWNEDANADPDKGLKKFTLIPGGIRCDILEQGENTWNQRIYSDVLSLTEGQSYRFTAEIRATQTGTGRFNAWVESASSKDPNPSPEHQHYPGSEFSLVNKVFTYAAETDDDGGSTGNQVVHLYPSEIMPAGSFWEARNISIKPINDKHHATTVFYGDDLWDLADNSVANFAVVAGSSAGVIGGATDGVKLTFGGTAEEVNGSYIALKDTSTNTLTEDLTVGRTYKLSGKFATDVAGATNAPRPAVWTSTSNYASSPTVSATNLVPNGTMEADSGWSGWSSPASEEQSDEQAHNGTYSWKFIPAEAGDGIDSAAFTTVTGTTYLVSQWVYPAGTVCRVAFRRGGEGVIGYTEDITGLTAGAWNKIEYQYTEVNGGSGAYVLIDSHTTTSGNFYVDDVVVTAFVEKEIEFTATHATDNTFNHFNCEYSATNEMIQIGSNANNSTFASSVGDWVAFDPNDPEPTTATTISHDAADGGFITINDTAESGSEGAKLAVGNLADIELGRSYTVLVEMKAESGTPEVKVGYGNHQAAAQTITTSRVTYAYKVTPTTDTNSLLVFTHSTSNIDIHVYNVQVFPHCNLYIDDISLKEVGTATGWTDADQQLDIAQPALQSYNELAWFDGVADYVDVNPTTDIWNASDGEWNSVSCWVCQDGDGGSGMYWMTAGTIGLYSSWINASTYRVGYNTLNGEVFGIEVANTVVENKWNHWVMNWKRNSNSNDTAIDTSDVELFLNGVKQTVSYVSGSNSNGATTLAQSDINFMSSATGGNLLACGVITEISAWKDQLTDAEVLELFNDGKALDASTHSNANLSAYWRNNGLSTWANLVNPGTNDGTPTSVTETILIPQGVDGSRDAQGFIMNRARNTSSLNLTNGSDDYIHVPTRTDGGDDDLAFIGVGDGFSVSCWVKKNNVSGGEWVINRNDATDGWRLGFDGDEKLKLQIEENTNIVAAVTDSVLSLNTWYHVVGTFDGDPSNNGSGVVKLYLNGVNGGDTTNDATSADMDASAANGIPLTIGSGHGGYFDGEIDGVLIYNKVLSQTEVTRNYKATKGSHRN